MNRSLMLSSLSGWLALLVVVFVSGYIWLKTNPSEAVVIDPSLKPIAVEQINAESTLELNSLIKNGNLPIVLTPADLGRDNPFAPL